MTSQNSGNNSTLPMYPNNANNNYYAPEIVNAPVFAPVLITALPALPAHLNFTYEKRDICYDRSALVQTADVNFYTPNIVSRIPNQHPILTLEQYHKDVLEPNVSKRKAGKKGKDYMPTRDHIAKIIEAVRTRDRADWSPADFLLTKGPIRDDKHRRALRATFKNAIPGCYDIDTITDASGNQTHMLISLNGTRRERTVRTAVEDSYSILCAAHIDQNGKHLGRDKTFDKLKHLTSDINKDIVADFVTTCQCQSKKRSHDDNDDDNGEARQSRKARKVMLTPSPSASVPSIPGVSNAQGFPQRPLTPPYNNDFKPQPEIDPDLDRFFGMPQIANDSARAGIPAADVFGPPPQCYHPGPIANGNYFGAPRPFYPRQIINSGSVYPEVPEQSNEPQITNNNNGYFGVPGQSNEPQMINDNYNYFGAPRPFCQRQIINGGYGFLEAPRQSNEPQITNDNHDYPEVPEQSNEPQITNNNDNAQEANQSLTDQQNIDAGNEHEQGAPLFGHDEMLALGSLENLGKPEDYDAQLDAIFQ